MPEVIISQPGQPLTPSAPIGFPTPPLGSGSVTPSTIPVWPILAQLPMQMSKAFLNVMVPLIDGYEQRVNKNEAYSHADGQGAVTANKGRWEFRIQFNGIEQANATPTKDVNTLWKFVTDRLGPYEAFYFYNPVEAGATIDLTGVATVGRYLVRLKDPLTSLEAFAVKIHRGQLSLIEVRG